MSRSIAYYYICHSLKMLVTKVTNTNILPGVTKLRVRKNKIGFVKWFFSPKTAHFHFLRFHFSSDFYFFFVFFRIYLHVVVWQIFGNYEKISSFDFQMQSWIDLEFLHHWNMTLLHFFKYLSWLKMIVTTGLETSVGTYFGHNQGLLFTHLSFFIFPKNL